MASDITTTSFPVSTSVALYVSAGCEPYKNAARAPQGITATDTQSTASTGVTTFSAVAAGHYYAVGTVDGVVKYVNVRSES
jgi:hypothetical protein